MSKHLKATDGTSGRYRTISLFWELRDAEDKQALFTTKPEDIVRDGIEYKSMKKLYFSYDHALLQ